MAYRQPGQRAVQWQVCQWQVQVVPCCLPGWAHWHTGAHCRLLGRGQPAAADGGSRWAAGWAWQGCSAAAGQLLGQRLQAEGWQPAAEGLAMAGRLEDGWGMQQAGG